MKLALKTSFNNWVKVGKEGEEFLIDYPTIEQEQFLQAIKYDDILSINGRVLKYGQYYIKFVVKDWKNVIDESGKPIKCIIKNNELEDKLWWALVSDEEMTMELYAICFRELAFTEND